MSSPNAVAMSGQDTIILNNRNFTALADGDCVTLDFPNGLVNVKIGKNGNALFGLNEMGNLGDVKIRVLRGTADDQFLNGILSAQQANFAGTALMVGQFVKKVGDGLGNISNDTYILAGGVVQKMVPGKMNVEGDTMQSVAEYTLQFASAARVIT